MTIDFSVITIYELFALILAALALVIPLIKWVWKKWIQKPILKYYANGTVRLLFNQSGSYLQIDGVYEAINKAISVKKIEVSVRRQKDANTLNLPWFNLISPFVQRVAGNAVQTNQTAHPFRVDADSMMCAFTEFADIYDSFGKTFKSKVRPLFQIISQIHTDTPEYSLALEKYQSAPEYLKIKALVEKEFFWEIGKYDVDIRAYFNNKFETYSFEFSVGDADYQLISQNIDEALVSLLKDAYGIIRCYQSVEVELKEK